MAKGKLNWFKPFMKLEHGIPSHDTFNRVFNRLDPEEFRKGFVSWVESICKRLPGEIIAIDGKQNCRTHDKTLGKKAIHMVSAWATSANLVLGQIKVDDKSNEITAIPELLDTLYLSGCIITIDAMGCQKKIAQKIIDCEADYVLALKDNQKNLRKDVETIFTSILENEPNGETIPLDYTNTVDINHGRVEIRECWTVSVSDVKENIRNISQWKNISSIILVRDERRIGNKVEVFKRYFISSLAYDAEKALFSVRSHWQIETSLHGVLDMAFDEDYCRLRTGHGSENFAILRHIALNLVKSEKTAEGGIKRRRLKAAVNSDYLLTVLTSVNSSNDEITSKNE